MDLRSEIVGRHTRTRSLRKVAAAVVKASVPIASIILLVAMAVAPAPAESIVEVTVLPMTGTSTVSGASSRSSVTYYGGHLRLDVPHTPFGLDARYYTNSQGGGTDNLWTGYLTYRWEGPQGILRLAAGYEGENAIGSSGIAGTQSSPIVGAEGVLFVGREWPGSSLELGALYLPSVSGNITTSSITAPLSGTGWAWYAGVRYTTPGSSFTITGGYNFLHYNLSISGTPATSDSSGPYISLGIAF